MLFQASALQGGSEPEPSQQALSVPALGRVTPIVLEPPEPEADDANLAWEPPQPVLPPPSASTLEDAASGGSFWPLAKMELLEALILACLNLILALCTRLQTGALGASYAELWKFLLPMHLVLSWSLLMVPLVLTGQSPLMGRFSLRLETAQCERRLAFSLFHLLSLALFPLSFVSMVLTPHHRTLAELLTGQDIVMGV